MHISQNILDAIPGLILTIGSLFFILLLLVSYFSKQSFHSARIKLYRYMLITVVLLLISEIISTLLIFSNAPEIVCLTALRIHWSTGFIWFGILYFYSLCFLKNISSTNLSDIIKNSSRSKLFITFSIVIFLIYFLIPFSDISKSSFSYLPGSATYYMLTYGSISVILITIYMLFNTKNAETRKKIAVLIMILEMIVITGLQYIFKNIAFFGIGATLQMFFLYFSIENPDLIIISELETLKEDIDKSSKAKSDFLFNMSHEIRSPMNAIVGFSATILNEQNFDKERTKNDIKHIASAGNNLLDIINNILDISKIESGKETLNKKEYSIGKIVMELSSIIEARIENRPIKMIVDVDKDIPSKLYGDSIKVFQILLNLLTNAVKYTEVGKIKLSIDKEINKDDVLLKFKVSDTGYGIKKEDYNKLFEKFSRLDTATTNEIEGTGLGLVITKKYIDLMDGRIWFDSEYGVGTSFYVELSQKIIDNTPIGNILEHPKNVNDIDYIDCSNYNILIVDDNKLNLKVAKKLLGAYKFNIDLVSSGSECIYNIKEGKHYDMIFLDHMMPEMDGIEVLHILKKLDDYKIPPVVALTANAIIGMKEMYLKEGFDEYLSKPINTSELNKLIKKYFDN